MKNKQILKEYENMEFNIHSYTEDIEIGKTYIQRSIRLF